MANIVNNNQQNPQIQQIDNKEPNKPAGSRVGSGFTNIQRILQANKPQVLGQQIGSNLQKTAQEAKDRLTGAEQQFRTEANKARLDTDESRQRIQQVLADPTKAGVGEYETFGKFRSGKFYGPTEIKDFGTLEGQAREAEELGKSVGSEGGRIGLLQRFAAKDRYTGGQQNLDSLLLGLSGEDLRKSARSTIGLEQEALRRQQAAQEYGKELQGKAQQFAQETQQQVSSKYDPLSTQLDARVQQISNVEKQRQDAFNDLQNIASKATSSDDIQAIIDTANKAATFGLLKETDINKIAEVLNTRSYGGASAVREALKRGFVQKNALDINREGLVSGEEAATLNALSRLAGKDKEFGDNLRRYQSGSLGFDATGFAQQGLGQTVADQTAEEARRAGIIENLSTIGLAPVAAPIAASMAAGEQAYQQTIKGLKNVAGGNGQGLSGRVGGALDISTAPIDASKAALNSLQTGQQAVSGATTGLAGNIQDASNKLGAAAYLTPLAPAAMLAGAGANTINAALAAGMTPAEAAVNATTTATGGVSSGLQQIAGGNLATGTGQLLQTPGQSTQAGIDSLQAGGNAALDNLSAAGNSLTKDIPVVGGLPGSVVSSAADLGKLSLAANLAPSQVTSDLVNKLTSQVGGGIKKIGEGDVVSGLGSIASAAPRAALEGLSSTGRALQQVKRQAEEAARAAASRISNAAKSVVSFFKKFSDKDLKTDITDGSFEISKFLEKLDPYTYQYKNKDHGIGKHTSIMAQDLEKSKIGKSFVEEHPEGKMVNYGNMMPMTLASLAYLNKRLDKLENEEEKQ